VTCTVGYVSFQLTYQSTEWRGQLNIEAEQANLAVAAFETTKDEDKQSMVNMTLYIHAHVLCFVLLEL